MSEFRDLERVYLAAVEASDRVLQTAPEPDVRPDQPGFKEAAQEFLISDPDRAMDAAEAACLAHQVGGLAELQPKAEFILRQMRQLTDETEEFDAYAERLLADIKTVIALDRN